MMKLSLKEHKERHVLLHGMLDELVADWITHNPDKRIGAGSIWNLIQWSHQQTENPTEKEASDDISKR